MRLESAALPCLRYLIVCALSTLAPGLGASVASGQSIEGLGSVPDGTQSYARGVSGDGLVVTGLAFIPPDNSSPATGYRAFRWTSDGMQNLGTLNGPGEGPYWFSSSRGASTDGSVIVGASSSADGERAYRWTDSGGMVSLGTLPGALFSWGFDVSDDGSVVVGSSGSTAGNPDISSRAFRWQNGVMTNLGTVSGYTSSIAYGVSGDGSVVVGKSTHAQKGARAFRWTGTGGMANLGTLSRGKYSEASATNSNGSVIVGVSDSAGGERAFRWTSGGMVSLGALPGDSKSHAWRVSGDGSAVVGSSGVNPDTPHPGSPGRAAFLWTGSLGMVDLNAYLPTLGIDLTDWTLREAKGISADGKTIVGYGTHDDGSAEAWIVRLP